MKQKERKIKKSDNVQLNKKKKAGRKSKSKKASDKKIIDKNKNKYDKQTKFAIIIMFLLIVSVLAGHWIIQESNKFEYKDLEFYRTDEGGLIVYRSLLGYATAGGETVPFVLKLRNSPKELEKIPINANITLDKKKVVLSLSPEIANCSNTTRSIMDASITFKAFGREVSAATTDEDFHEENDVPLIDCGDSVDKNVIIIKEGIKTRIKEDKTEVTNIIITSSGRRTEIKNRNCYIIEVANCEIQEAYERFILDFIANSVRK